MIHQNAFPRSLRKHPGEDKIMPMTLISWRDMPELKLTESDLIDVAVVAFKDVQSSWNKDIRMWDGGRHVYIGRANSWYGFTRSKWANRYRIGHDGDRLEVVQKYMHDLQSRSDLINAIEELRGKILVCYCAPELCHGHVLLAKLLGKI